MLHTYSCRCTHDLSALSKVLFYWPASAAAGEILTWVSLYALAAHPSVWAKCPWVAASPAFVSFLLLYVSGELLVTQVPGLSCGGLLYKHRLNRWLQGCQHWRRVTASGMPRETMRLADPSESTRQRPTCWCQGLRRLFEHSRRSDHRNGKASLHTQLSCWTVTYGTGLHVWPSRPCEQSFLS